MKSDVIRKRARHEVRAVGGGGRGWRASGSATPSGGSPRASPAPLAVSGKVKTSGRDEQEQGHEEDEPSSSSSSSAADLSPSCSPMICSGGQRQQKHQPQHPTLAPDSSTAVYHHGYSGGPFDGGDTGGASGAAGGQDGGTVEDVYAAVFGSSSFFPGPYHPDYLAHLYGLGSPTVPGVGVGVSDASRGSGSGSADASPRMDMGMGMGGMNGMGMGVEMGMMGRKRRRMSADSASASASEPPSSATSYTSSFNDSLLGGGSAYGDFTFGGGAGYRSSPPSTASCASTCASPMKEPTGTIPSNGVHAFWHPPMMMPQVECGGSPVMFHQHLQHRHHSTFGSGTEKDATMDYLAGGGRSRSGSGSGSGDQPSTASNNGGNGGDIHQHQRSRADSTTQTCSTSHEKDDAADAFFSSFLHPPMAIPEDASALYGGLHPPMMVDYQELYEAALRAYY